MKETYQPDTGTHETDQTPGSRGELMIAKRALQQAALSKEVITPIEALSLEEWCERIKSATDKVRERNKRADSLSGPALHAYLKSTRSVREELRALINRAPDHDVAAPIDTTHAEIQTTKEQFSLPHGFTTEKGSVYQYDESGHAKRWKFDHTEHEPTGITVFIEGTEENLDIITRDGIDQSEVASEKRERSFIIEAEGGGKWHKVYDINDVQSPDRLAFARIMGSDTITGLAPASLQPSIGAHVYEITKLENGSISHHPGHKVSTVFSDRADVDTQIERLVGDLSQTPERSASVTTFEQARALKGNSIDDILTAIERDGINLDDLSGGGPFDKYVRKRALRSPSHDEIDFFKLRTPGNAADYDVELVNFTNRLIRENPYPDKRRVTHSHIGWLQHSSKGFIKDRVENGSKDKPSARIYLTPKFDMDMIHMYEEIFEEGERAGLRFNAKVYDPHIRRDPERIRKYKDTYIFDKRRTDPMVFYPFEESKDALLAIVQKVYEKHKSSFDYTHTGAIPTEIAPGLAVGSEPKGHSGNESLTSHRDRLGLAFERAAANPGWQSADSTLRRNLCKEYLLKVCEENNIDPNNIAFDAR